MKALVGPSSFTTRRIPVTLMCVTCVCSASTLGLTFPRGRVYHREVTGENPSRRLPTISARGAGWESLVGDDESVANIKGVHCSEMSVPPFP